MDVLRSTENQTNLPRYFAQVFRVAAGLNHGRLDFVLPDGRRFRVEGPQAGPVAEIHVHDPDVFARLIREGDLGFCDAYLDGGWSTPDLMSFMDFVHADNDAIYDGFPGMAFVRAYERMRHLLRSNSKRQAKRNIAYHYDLGNEFYALWLDKTMTYSSALFRTGQESLEAAQKAKYASMVDRMGVKPGDHVLEIGCGWGGFAEYAAKERGLRVTGLTISQAQLDYARERIRQPLGGEGAFALRAVDAADPDHPARAVADAAHADRSAFVALADDLPRRRLARARSLRRDGAGRRGVPLPVPVQRMESDAAAREQPQRDRPTHGHRR